MDSSSSDDDEPVPLAPTTTDVDALASTLRELEESDTLLVDTRPSSHYYAGHIKGAVNVCFPPGEC